MSLADIKLKQVRKELVMGRIYRLLQEAGTRHRQPIYFDNNKHQYNVIEFEYEGRKYRLELEEL